MLPFIQQDSAQPDGFEYYTAPWLLWKVALFPFYQKSNSSSDPSLWLSWTLSLIVTESELCCPMIS